MLNERRLYKCEPQPRIESDRQEKTAEKSSVERRKMHPSLFTLSHGTRTAPLLSVDLATHVEIHMLVAYAYTHGVCINPMQVYALWAGGGGVGKGGSGDTVHV